MQSIIEQKKIQIQLSETIEKASSLSQTVRNNQSGSSTSQIQQKQQKQSSNDGLNTSRSYPSSLVSGFNPHLQKDHTIQNETMNKVQKQNKKNNQFKNFNINLQRNQQSHTDVYENGKFLQQKDQQLNQQHYQLHNGKFTFIRLLMILFKRQYALELIRILIYAFVSIAIFSYVLDQNKQKKQFYQSFYSSQQITISKQINGVFPPLFGNSKDLLNFKWLLQQSFHSTHLLSQSSHPSTSLIFEFLPQNILYIKPSSNTCLQQLKYRYKTFDYNMKVYQIVQTQFQKIETVGDDCFQNRKQVDQLVRQVSIWTIDWESKQLYLLTQPYKYLSTNSSTTNSSTANLSTANSSTADQSTKTYQHSLGAPYNNTQINQNETTQLMVLKKINNQMK